MDPNGRTDRQTMPCACDIIRPVCRRVNKNIYHIWEPKHLLQFFLRSYLSMANLSVFIHNSRTIFINAPKPFYQRYNARSTQNKCLNFIYLSICLFTYFGFITCGKTTR
jgi:hypothetical protein